MSKYASLPDIDTAPDVYETPDVPTVLVTERDEEPKTDGPSHVGPNYMQKVLNDDINQNSLDQPLARRRFETAVGLDGTNADFSMSLSKSQTRRSSARYPLPPRRTFETGEYSVLPKGYAISSNGQDSEEETPLQRLRRLRIEIEELEEELKAEDQKLQLGTTVENVKADAHDSSVEMTSASTIAVNPARAVANTKGKLKTEPSPAELLAQLQHMRSDLGKLSSSFQPSEQSSTLASKLKQREAYARNLLQQLTRGPGSDPDSTERHAANRSSSKTLGASSINAAKLDERLHAVESLLGSTSLLQASSIGDVTLPPPLLVTLSKLEHQLSLLTQPRHLDSVSRRVKVIVTDLERVAAARAKLSDTRPLSLALASGITVVNQAAAGNSNVITSLTGVPGVLSPSSSGAQDMNLPPDALHKLEQLYNLLSRIDPLLPLVPHLLTRLRSLADLHGDAHQFSQNLAEAGRELSQLGQRSKGLEEILKGVESSVMENEVVIKNNLGLVEERIEGLVGRLDRLASQT